MYNYLTVIAVPSSYTIDNNLPSYPILEQDDIIHVDINSINNNNNNNNNDLKVKLIINNKMHQRQNIVKVAFWIEDIDTVIRKLKSVV